MTPLRDRIVWLGRGMYVRSEGVWYNERTCPKLTSNDYQRVYLHESPSTMTVIDAEGSVRRGLAALKLAPADSYANLDNETVMKLVSICAKWRIPYAADATIIKGGWFRKSRIVCAFAAPLGELLK